jgi:hypothetical protein
MALMAVNDECEGISMTQQTEFDFSSRGWRKYAVEQCRRLRDLNVTEGNRSIRLNPSEAKVLLLRIADFDRCYCSMEYLANETGIRLRNVERLIKAMHLSGMLEIRKVPRERGQFPANQYVVFWSDLIDSPSVQPSATIARSTAQPSATPTATPSATPTATMADKLREELKEENNNKQATAVVVVSLEEVGIVDPAKTYSLAQSVLQLTDEQILERIAHWRSLPADHPHRHSGPGVLHRWLTRPRSWHMPTSDQPKLQLRKLSDCTQENRRAELIRYGKSNGWTHQQLQAAVLRLEDECLQSQEESSCQPQPESRERNQLALVRTEKSLNRRF